MATLATLAQQGGLTRIDPELGHAQQEERLIYGVPTFVEWLENRLPQIESVLRAPDTPLEQVDAVFADFAAGEAMAYGKEFRRLRPGEDGVWEMRTPDIRIFGWFPNKDCFVAVFGDDASRIKDHGLYAGYRDQVVRARNDLDLDEPKYLDGAEIEDVIST